MGENKLDLQQYKESLIKTFGGVYVMSKLSPEMKAMDKAFKAYLDNSSDNTKSDAERALKSWKDSTVPKCIEELGKGASLLINIEFTLNAYKPKVFFKKHSEPNPFENGKFTCYRGDERSPDKIKEDGFDLWEESKNAIQSGLRSYFEKAFAHYVDVPGASGSAAWANHVRVSKNRGRPTISTSLDDGCGGYTSGCIYKMKIDGLTQYTMTKEVMGINVPWKSPLRLYLNKPTLAESTIVGINLNLSTWEVVFMTFIDPIYIKKVKIKGGDAFQDL